MIKYNYEDGQHILVYDVKMVSPFSKSGTSSFKPSDVTETLSQGAYLYEPILTVRQTILVTTPLVGGTE